jgi:hypothetical protein
VKAEDRWNLSRSEFIDIHALDLRITKLPNPYFSKLCIIVSLNEVRL